MNSNQIEVIAQYLKIETNYAVIINGNYGTGKTHFYKNELSQEIKKIHLPKNDQKNYIPIHISLFGFKNLEEIQTAIFVELFPILKNRNIKLAAGIGKSIIRGIAQINRAGDIDKYIGDITQDPNDWLNYDELVICFDDLDRKSESLDLRDVFGFINSLVENQGAKILIIANEVELFKDKNYSVSLREKVIGVSIQFSPIVADIYDRIIESRYSSGDKIYFEFLGARKDQIVETIEKNESNFRNLIFFLEHFKTIFYPIEKLFQDDEKFKIQKDEKLSAILSFTLAISIEYKLGYLNSTNFKDIEGINDDIFASIDLKSMLEAQTNNNDEEKKEEPSYIETFRTKYFSKSQFYFFKAIFEYIIGLRAFIPETLKRELDDYFLTEEGEVPEHEIVLSKLGYFDCLKLSNKEYRRLSAKMMSFVDQGKYQLRQYGTVFHFATRFDNILNYDLTRLKERFKKGIKKGVSHYQYSFDLGFHMTISSDTEFKDDVSEIIRFCIEINKGLEETKNSDKLSDVFNQFKNDFEGFIETVRSHDSQYRFEPFWLNFDVKSVYRVLKKLDNESIWRFGHYITDRYRKNIYHPLYPEKDFIQKLKQLIDQPTKARSKKTLHNASLDYVSKCITEVEENFPT